MTPLTDLLLSTPDETRNFAAKLGAILGPGDTLLLAGPVGAGKSHFARSLIQSRQKSANQTPEDVPSPTFTLVQTYHAGALEIWHCDLYRLTSPDEVLELGLEDAFDTALCLIEWPDRLGSSTPADALTLSFSPLADSPDSRRLTLSGSPKWAARLSEILGVAP